MKIIVGLGNPLPKYKGTRHNIGQVVVSCFQEMNNFPEFKLKKKFASLISERKIENKKVILVLPQTFMNESGLAIKKIVRNWKLEIRNLIVVHDDIDLPLGKIRIRKNGSSGGHKGVQSIIDYLKNKNFVRFKIGINQKSKIQFKIQNLEDFVLQKFEKKEKEMVKKIIKKTCQEIESSLKKFQEKTITLK